MGPHLTLKDGQRAIARIKVEQSKLIRIDERIDRLFNDRSRVVRELARLYKLRALAGMQPPPLIDRRMAHVANQEWDVGVDL